VTTPGFHLGGREENKREANETNGQIRRSPSVKAEHSRSTKLAVSIIRDSVFDQFKRLFTKLDSEKTLRVFRPKCTCLVTFLPERLSPSPYRPQTKASGRLSNQP
jgi:hypothetical protein